MSVDKLREELLKLAAENDHLKKIIEEKDALIAISESTPPVTVVTKSQEEVLIEGQLALLRSRSEYEEFTLEDMKKLDLLLKNQRLLRDKRREAQEVASTVVASSLPSHQLVALARTKQNGNE
jgi:hypothetical protein